MYNLVLCVFLFEDTLFNKRSQFIKVELLAVLKKKMILVLTKMTWKTLFKTIAVGIL